jgi:flagellar hook-associated protein 2
MSIGNSAGISFAGLGSGIDTDSIVSRLMQLEGIGVTRLQNSQKELQGKMSLYSQYRSVLSTLKTSVNSLNSASVFNPMKANSSDSAVASLVSSSSSAAGSYALKSYQLAQSNKVSTTAQNDLDSALGLTGTFSVNGKSISIVSTDSLKNVAEKLNNAGGDFTASVINGGTGQTYLTVTAKDSGRLKNLRMEDTSGSVLSTLGLMSTSVRQAVTNGALSNAASSATQKLSEIAGFTGTGTFNVTVNGATVSVDMTNDTLTTLKDKINAAAGGSGVTATVESSTEMGRTVYRLQVVGAGSTPTFGSEKNFFTDLGILKRTNELISARDAYYSLDGVNLTSATNSITDAIPGSTLTLLTADATTPKTSDLSLTRDDDSVVKSVKAFVDAYNNVTNFVKQYSGFDKETYEAGPLFGDAITQQTAGDLSNLLFGDITGNSTGYTNLALVGFTLDDSGQFTVDESKLKTALAADPTALSKLFKTTGTVTGANLTFAGNTVKTPSSALPLDIVITQAATKSSMTAGKTMTTLAQDETLTFGGDAFGGTPVTLQLTKDTGLSAVIDQINNNASLKDRIVASESGGALVITSVKYGTPGRFTVTSNVASNDGGTGIGTTGEPTFVNGLDVAGTIGGYAATGSGQVLTGKDEANNGANGLQIIYSGSGSGTVGQINFLKGVAMRLNDKLDGFLDSVSGSLTQTDKAMQSQVDDYTARIADLQVRLTSKEQRLRAQFLAMETAISNAKQQQARLTAMMGSSSG